MQCPNCKQIVPDAANVCGYCGQRLRASQPAQPPSAVPPPAAPVQSEDLSAPRKRSPGRGRALWAGALGLLVIAAILAVVFIPRLSGGSSDAALWIPTFHGEPLPPGAWSVGKHTYAFKGEGEADCQFESEPVVIQVSETAPLYPDPVVIRPRGLYRAILGGEPFYLLHPQQDTAPWVLFVENSRGMPRAEAQAILDNCSVFFRVDGGPWNQLMFSGMVLDEGLP